MTMRLRMAPGSSRPAPARNNRHISCIGEYTGAAGDPGTAGKAEMNTTAHAHDTTAPAARPARWADAGTIRLAQRDIDGLLLVREHTGAPMTCSRRRSGPGRLPALTARWRRAGYAATGRLGPGPGWCWLTRDGMAATGLGFPATRPALGRLAHLRAILAARLWMAANPAWQQGQAWWHSERRLRAEQPAAGRKGHIPDAEVHWPSLAGSRTPGRCGRSRWN